MSQLVLTTPSKDNTPRGMYRLYPKWSRELRKEILFGWWHEILPKHFTPKGEHEYEYAKRTVKYAKRKTRQKHHRDPLVWTGKLRDFMLRRMPAAVVTKNESKLTFRGAPKYTFITSQIQRSFDGTRTVVVAKPDMRSELIAVSNTDMSTMVKWLNDGFSKRIKAAQSAVGGS